MQELFKNMLPYWHIIVVIFLLLGVQAYCDLSLPQYTSDIIDVGIQNKGIKHIFAGKDAGGRISAGRTFYDRW